MCEDAGITERKTNHSLRATGTTALFSAVVPEKTIRNITGHRSNALKLYERTSLHTKKSCIPSTCARPKIVRGRGEENI